jgi:hypothetical protein
VTALALGPVPASDVVSAAGERAWTSDRWNGANLVPGLLFFNAATPGRRGKLHILVTIPAARRLVETCKSNGGKGQHYEGSQRASKRLTGLNAST